MNLEMIRGTTNTFRIQVKENGSPYTLTGDEKILFAIKDKPYKEHADLIKFTTTMEDGLYILTIEPEDTIGLKYGFYFYDVVIESVSAGALWPVVAGRFVLLPNANRFGDGEGEIV